MAMKYLLPVMNDFKTPLLTIAHGLLGYSLQRECENRDCEHKRDTNEKTRQNFSRSLLFSVIVTNFV